MFGEFPMTDRLKSDMEFINGWNEQFREEFLSREDIYKSLSVKNINNVELVEGNICNTVMQYVEEHPYLRIALLHIDTDVYEPTMAGLENLYERVVKGGVIILDDYAVIEGETRAVDDFFVTRIMKFISSLFPLKNHRIS